MGPTRLRTVCPTERRQRPSRPGRTRSPRRAWAAASHRPGGAVASNRRARSSPRSQALRPVIPARGSHRGRQRAAPLHCSTSLSTRMACLRTTSGPTTTPSFTSSEAPQSHAKTQSRVAHRASPQGRSSTSSVDRGVTTSVLVREPSERDPRIAEAGRESPPKGPSSLRRCGGRAGAPARPPASRS